MRRPPPPPLPRLYTVDESAERLRCSERQMWRWIRDKELQVYRLGRTVRIAEDELARFLAQRRG